MSISYYAVRVAVHSAHLNLAWGVKMLIDDGHLNFAFNLHHIW